MRQKALRFSVLPLGNRKRELEPEHAMWKCLALGLLMAGLVTPAWAQGPARFDGQYVGELTLRKVVSGDCTRPPLGARYPLIISGNEVQFKYVPRFDTVLRGKVDQNGTFTASRDLRAGSISMTGHVQGNKVTARISSPSCIYTFRTRE
jgi:hypothetical protein